MMDNDLLVKQGELIAFTSGEYSNYSFNGVWRALQDCDMDALGKRYMAENPEQAEPYCFEDHAFNAWLVSTGYFEEVPVREFWKGSGRCWEPDIHEPLRAT